MNDKQSQLSSVPIDDCRLCGSGGEFLDQVLDLGWMENCSVFPATVNQEVPGGPLELVKCGKCGLVQLSHKYDRADIDNGHYGYRSGLAASMVKHLGQVAELAMTFHPGATSVLDIGANDATLLRAFPDDMWRGAVEPNYQQFARHYPDTINVFPEYFSASTVFERVDIITSIAMLYDLDDPMRFALDINRGLNDGGIWVTEQSYLPTMLEQGSYDTICHEHATYYGLEQLAYIAHYAGFKIVHHKHTATNGGSLLVVFRKGRSEFDQTTIDAERRLTDAVSFARFGVGMERSKRMLLAALDKFDVVYGLGASTKGNTILQYCDIDLPAIVEVNSDKFGRYTPGRRIPIIDEEGAQRPDAYLVLPWHFRPAIEKRYPDDTLIFPIGTKGSEQNVVSR